MARNPRSQQPTRIERDAVAFTLPEDVLVFRAADRTVRLIGGRGRGNGWADLVEFPMDDEPIIRKAWQSGVLLRLDAAEPVRIVGPYWAAHVVAAPVGREHLVVFGSRGPITGADALLVQAAARAVADTRTASAEKLLADELEVVHAVRALTAYRPENVRDTARHIGFIAAHALSCDVAAVLVRRGDISALEVMRVVDGMTPDADGDHAGPDAGTYLTEARELADPVVEQDVGPDPRVWAQAIASRLTLPIGSDERMGALALGHALDRPRGFTTLCQRIGRALAEASESLLEQALARERLAAEHEILRLANSTDSLTGVGNRARWIEVATTVGATGGGGHPIAVLSIDLDGLKTVNDRYGHSIGDSVIRSAATVLRTSIRDSDVLCRVGGDEFLVLLFDADEGCVRRVLGRIRRGMRSRRISEIAISPVMSIGWAVCEQGDVQAAVAAADRRMYLAKRRRSRSATSIAAAASRGQATADRRGPRAAA